MGRIQEANIWRPAGIKKMDLMVPLGASTKHILTRRESFDPDLVLASYIPNSAGGFTADLKPVHFDFDTDTLILYRRDDGQEPIKIGSAHATDHGPVLDVTTFRSDLVQDVAYVLTVPMNPHAHREVMNIFPGIRSFVDLPTPDWEEAVIKGEATVIRKIIESGQPAHVGEILDISMLDPAGRTVEHPHRKFYADNRSMGSISMHDLRENRELSDWDHGVSRWVAACLIKQLGNDFREFVQKETGGDVDWAEDGLGLTGHFSRFSWREYQNPDFQMLWRRFHHTMYWHLERFQRTVFTTELNEIANYISECSLGKRMFDEAEYRNFFNRREGLPDYDEWRGQNEAEILNELEDMGRLRHPAGWAYGMIWQDNQQGEPEMMLGVMIGTIREKLGNVQVWNEDLLRSKKYVPQNQLYSIATFDKYLINAAIDEGSKNGNSLNGLHHNGKNFSAAETVYLAAA